jgi:NAD-dependent deacetylase
MMPQHPANLSRAADYLRSARRVVVFTGAGVSAESGIPTFRDADGFWAKYPVEDFATWPGLQRVMKREPQRLAEFLHAVLHPVALAQPNAGHRAIAELEKHTPVTVVTQNVDRLHQDAGSRVVHEVHGSLFDIVGRGGRVLKTLTRAAMLDIAEALEQACHRRPIGPRVALALRPWAGLSKDGPYRPGIVLFGDSMAEPAWTNAMEACCRCDCMIQVGTSATVMPAAMLPREAQDAGAKLITIDPNPGYGHVWLAGTAAAVLPQLVAAAFGQ